MLGKKTHILLYHSVNEYSGFNNPPYLHNVSPQCFGEQMIWMSNRFKAVDVDELAIDYKPGCFAVTFDDAYNSAVTNALPILEELKIPCTIYVNGATLAGRTLWRDKLREIMRYNLVERMLKEYPELSTAYGINTDNLFSASKHPRVPSDVIESYIDLFLQKSGIKVESEHCLSSLQSLTRFTGVKVGNHTINHYILSSLTAQKQREEIEGNRELLEQNGLEVSKVFSVPNGQEHDLNRHTLEIIHKNGYYGYLLSRERSNGRKIHRSSNGLAVLERFLAPSSLFQLKKIVYKYALSIGLR